MMSLDDFLVDKCVRIDAQAERDKDAAKYVCGIIAEREEQLLAVYDPLKKWPEDESTEKLYAAIEETFEKMVKKIQLANPALMGPEGMLGWAHVPDMAYVLTAEGERVFDGYAALKGWCSAGELKDAFKNRIMKLAKAVNGQ